MDDTLTAKLRAAGLMDCFEHTSNPDGWRGIVEQLREGLAKGGVTAEQVEVGRALQVWRTTDDGEVLKVHAIHLREPARNLGMTVEFCVARMKRDSWRDRPAML